MFPTLTPIQVSHSKETNLKTVLNTREENSTATVIRKDNWYKAQCLIIIADLVKFLGLIPSTHKMVHSNVTL